MKKRKIFDISYYRKYQSSLPTISDTLNLIMLNIPTVGNSSQRINVINHHMLGVLVSKRTEWLGGSSSIIRVHPRNLNTMNLSALERAIANLGAINNREIQIMIDYKKHVTIVIAGTTVYIGFDRFINDVFGGRTDIIVDLLDYLGINHNKIECGYGMPHNNEQKCESGFYRIDGLNQTIARFLLIDNLLDIIHDALDGLAKNKAMWRYNFMRFHLAVVREPDECIMVFRNVMKQYIAYQEKKRHELEKPKASVNYEYSTDFGQRIIQPCTNKLYYFYTGSMAANRYTKELLSDDSCRAVDKIIRDNVWTSEDQLYKKSLIFHISDLRPILSEIELWNLCVRDHRKNRSVIHTVSMGKIYKRFKYHVDEVAMKYIDTALLAYMWENELSVYNELICIEQLFENKHRKFIEDGQCSYQSILRRYLKDLKVHIQKQRKLKALADEKSIALALRSARGNPSYWDRSIMTPSDKETSWLINNAINENFEYDDPELAYKYMSMKKLFPEN